MFTLIPIIAIHLTSSRTHLVKHLVDKLWTQWLVPFVRIVWKNVSFYSCFDSASCISLLRLRRWRSDLPWARRRMPSNSSSARFPDTSRRRISGRCSRSSGRFTSSPCLRISTPGCIRVCTWKMESEWRFYSIVDRYRLLITIGTMEVCQKAHLWPEEHLLEFSAPYKHRIQWLCLLG